MQTVQVLCIRSLVQCKYSVSFDLFWGGSSVGRDVTSDCDTMHISSLLYWLSFGTHQVVVIAVLIPSSTMRGMTGMSAACCVDLSSASRQCVHAVDAGYLIKAETRILHFFIQVLFLVAISDSSFEAVS